MTETLLEVRNLGVAFHNEDGVVRAVDGVSFGVARGEIVGLVGESGAGKTLTAEAIDQWAPAGSRRLIVRFDSTAAQGIVVGI